MACRTWRETFSQRPSRMWLFAVAPVQTRTGLAQQPLCLKQGVTYGHIKSCCRRRAKCLNPYTWHSKRFGDFRMQSRPWRYTSIAFRANFGSCVFRHLASQIQNCSHCLQMACYMKALRCKVDKRFAHPLHRDKHSKLLIYSHDLH